MKTYNELIDISDYIDRFNFLKLDGLIGKETFGSKRKLNQILYQMAEWKSVRKAVILRDGGFDMAHEDYPIRGPIYVHHINPITLEDIVNRNPKVFDLNNLISVSFYTHNAIHYSDQSLLEMKIYTPRSPNDTVPWKGNI